jgi:hypothetical protein
MRALTGRTTRKNTAAAMSTNVITAFRNWPYWMLLSLMVMSRSPKSTLPGMAMTGVRMFSTNDVTTAAKAAPMTTPTARSTTLPRSTKVLKSLSTAAV